MRPAALVRAGVLVCLVATLVAAGGGLTGPATPAARPSGWSQLPLAARGPVAAAIASHDPAFRVSRSTGGLAARNPVHRFHLRFSPAGVGVSTAGGQLSLALRTVGRGASGRRLAEVQPRLAAPNRTVFRRAGVSEWYANSQLGLEQGFTLRHRPGGHGDLTFTVGLGGSLATEATQHGRTVSFGPLLYSGLAVTDSRGHTLPSHLHLASGRLLISVSDGAARYPVRVDPFLQSAALTSSDGAANDGFGSSVAVSGTTIAVGAPNHAVGSNTAQGAVYVFTEPGTGWADATQTAELTASDGAANDAFGSSVAMSGDTIAVGAPFRTVGGNSNQGAVYVFERPGGGWADGTQTAELTASDGATNDNLGWSVAVNGLTVTTGAPSRTVGGHDYQGAVYVYTKPGGGWTDGTQTAELTASDGATGDELGSSVAMSVDTIAAASPFRTVGGNAGAGTVYEFTKPAGAWTDATQTAELTASDGTAGDNLGWSVAIGTDTIAAGSPFRTVGGNSAAGAVYVFAKPAGAWASATQTGELTASDGAAGDDLGVSVALGGSTVTAGASGHTVGSHSAQGAVYVYAKPGGGWANATETTELSASSGAAGDQLGSSVAVSGTTIAGGAPFRSVGGQQYQGAAYAFSNGLAISTTQQPASATVGSAIADKATVSGGDNPTGTVTFRLYNNGSAAGSPLYTDTKTLANGTATSAGYTTTAPGTYYWVATYNGDANNDSISSGTADEPVTVKASPSLSTTQQPTSAKIGSSIADQATVTGPYNPTGTVTFKLYNNATATGSALFTDTKTLSNGIAVSGGYAPTAAGTYYWVVSYSGDANDFAAASGPADEPVTITKATPSVATTQQPATAVVGSAIADQATVSGGYNPSGTVTFRLYNNAGATGSPLFTDTKTLSSGSATSAGYAPTAPGTYYWVATYNGDGNNNAVSSPTADEPVTVTKATPSVSTTQQPASAAVGSSIADKATLSAAYQATGTVTFTLYDNSNGTGTALFTDTEPVASGSATSAGYPTTATGTYYWVATYSGDSNNNGASSGTADEPVTVSQALPSVSSAPQPASAVVGSSIADQATVSGGLDPSGTVTFKLYDNANGTGAAVFTDTQPLSSGHVTSASYATTSAGTYYWVATYNGDTNNGVASSGLAAAPVTVTKATPALAAKRLPKSAKVHKPIAERATVSRGYSPSGTVTFRLYTNKSAKGKPVFTSTKKLSHGKATSGKYKTKAPGKYYWVVSYSGDANNAAVSSGKASQPVVIKH